MIQTLGGYALIQVIAGTCSVYSSVGPSAVLQEVEEPQQKGVHVGKTSRHSFA